jgi:hypothetical protein
MEVKITDLPSATNVSDNDVLPIVQNGTTKKIAKSLLTQPGLVTLYSAGETASTTVTLSENLSQFDWIDIVWQADIPTTRTNCNRF